MSPPALEIRDLVVRHAGGTALHGVSLEVRRGEIAALVGANGAGKSTLLRAVIGLERSASGTIAFDGARIETLQPHRRAALGIGYSPEGRRVFPGMTVRENLEVASDAGRRETQRRLEEMLEMFPRLGEKIDTASWALSGGQQQMLALARALMRRPHLLLLDEPSLGLSPIVLEDVYAGIRRAAASDVAVLLAEQAVTRALAAATSGHLMRLGRIVASGAAADLMRDPRLRAAYVGT
ncbi:MAG TPA: ABC transporter ATP-binding protein [Alphaproteobacteria bacterium]|nr:ABC transporter ATP-binding protein [Alphaproteobacteria bacterium]